MFLYVYTFTFWQVANKLYIYIYIITYFGQVKNNFGQVKTINYLPGMASYFWKLCWCLQVMSMDVVFSYLYKIHHWRPSTKGGLLRQRMYIGVVFWTHFFTIYSNCVLPYSLVWLTVIPIFHVCYDVLFNSINFNLTVLFLLSVSFYPYLANF